MAVKFITKKGTETTLDRADFHNLISQLKARKKAIKQLNKTELGRQWIKSKKITW